MILVKKSSFPMFSLFLCYTPAFTANTTPDNKKWAPQHCGGEGPHNTGAKT